ncbi:hypothetical protein PybrP1_011143 [[Pythium] brassicae (nom. inval.)]|nr:hypothetical protein PybrP1_011143 [[Pythium] brassicae (nom. inval.)]
MSAPPIKVHNSSVDNNSAARVEAAATGSRLVLLGRLDQTQLFASNAIKTSVYTAFNFVPKNLFKQFTRFSNIYFLFITALQLLPDVTSSNGVPTMIVPLFFVIVVSGTRDLVEDLQRHRADEEQNLAPVSKLHFPETAFAAAVSAHVKVGELVRVAQNEAVSADIVLVSTSNATNGQCFVTTANLDGESSLKPRYAHPSLCKALAAAPPSKDGKSVSTEVLKSLDGVKLGCEPPNRRIDKFKGSILFPSGSSAELDISHVLLRGTHLKDTDWVVGCVVYTGNDTRVRQNSSDTPLKTSWLYKFINKITLWIVLAQIGILVVAVMIEKHLVASNSVQKNPYIPDDTKHGTTVDYMWLFLTYMLLFSNFVPISLQVTIDFTRYFQSLVIVYDKQSSHSPRLSCSITSKNVVVAQTLSPMFRFFLNLALNNSVSPGIAVMPSLTLTQAQTRSVAIEYSGPSPDERALVIAAARIGVELQCRDNSHIQLCVHGKPVAFDILHIFEFTSERKKSSIMCRESVSGRLMLFCKGADSVVLSSLSDRNPSGRVLLAKEQMQMYSANGLRSKTTATQFLRNELDETWRDSQHQPTALLVNDVAVEAIRAYGIESEFLLLCARCESVLCARISPKQKEFIVEMVRRFFPDKVTMAVGDGANDVPMIQRAHIGVGIAGEEGHQASDASDYSIPAFKHLQQLVLVHGRWMNRRVSILTLYIFYKNVLLVLPQFVYGGYCLYSGQSTYYDTLLQLFNICFTALPVLYFAVLDQDISAQTMVQYPKLYQDGFRHTFLNARVFAYWIFEATIASIVIVLVPARLIPLAPWSSEGKDNDLWSMGLVQNFTVVFLANARLLMEVTSNLGVVGALVLASLAFWWLVVFVMSASVSFGREFYGILRVGGITGLFLCCAFCSVAGLFSAFVPKVWRVFIMPSAHSICREIDSMNPIRRLGYSETVFPIDKDERGYSRLTRQWTKFYNQHRHIFSRFAFPILDPRSNPKLAWDSLIMAIVLYSAILIPIEVGFPDLEFGVGWRWLSIVLDVLFCLDVLQNFFVGFYVSEEEPMARDRRQIARRYLSSWFLPDVLAIIPADYVINGVSTASRDNSVLSLKLARMIRLVRISKLARLLKLRQFVMKLEDALELDAVFARMTRLISQVLLVTHILSCFWHYVGYTDDAMAVTWLTALGLAQETAHVRYLYSFYWVIVTVAGVGYGDVHATNTDERLFAMVTMIIGAGGFGVIIANITEILENWNREAATRARKLGIVQEFVKKKAIPKQLKSRLLRYFRHYIAKTSAFDERELLCEFSLSLRGEILQETYKNSFFRIPAFQRLSPQFVLDMAMYIKPLIAVTGDVLARENAVGTEMFILNSGVIEVKRTAPNHEWIVVLEILTEHGIFGESSLLNYTLHQNSYIAKSSCDLYTLPKEDFDRLIEESPEVEQTLLTYHRDRSALYDRVFQQTLARYRVYLSSQMSDPVSELIGIENVYPTLTVLLDGVLTSYRSVPIPILQRMTLDLSMGVSVFNSATEKQRMIDILSRDDERLSVRERLRAALAAPIPPDHPCKLAWDIAIGVQLLYCAAAIPFEITFLAESAEVASQWLAAVNLAIDAMFALDIALNFRTAVVDRAGRLDTTPLGIARAYVRSWFLVDVLAVLPMATVMRHCVGASVNAAGSRSIVYLRIVRLLKLTRVLKLLRMIMRVETVAVPASHSTLRVVRLLFKVWFIAHLLTCGFYYVSLTSADAYGDSLMRWMPTYYSAYEKYVFCLYWAVSTMTTVGYGDANPGNPAEVAYVTFGVLIGASTFTYVVGTLSSLVDERHATADTYRERMDHLKAYLKDRNIPKPLGARLRRYYEYYLLQRDDENEDTILSALSDNLRTQLVLHLNRDVVRKIAFFASQDDACVSYLMSILDPEFCTPGEYVFKEGQVGRHMYFLVKGVAEVLFHAGEPKEAVVATLMEGSYFGEIAMLTMSKRAASIRAKTYTSLFVLSRSGLDRISLHYPEMASSIIQEFRKKITHIKKTSLRHLAPLIDEDVRAARVRNGLYGGGGNLAELAETLEALESVVSRIVEVYGGGDKGKRKALACVMQHLRKFEFSLDDFLHAAEDFSLRRDSSVTPASSSGSLAKVAYSVVMLNRLQLKMRRRSSFS